LNPGSDHSVIDDPSDAVLVDEIRLQLVDERIAVRKHTAEGEVGAGHPEARISQDGADDGEATEGETGAATSACT
jgi:hypothetical protein